MTKPNFKEIYPNGIDAELCEGYYDGVRPDSPEPDSDAHPAYVHGFLNGRDDSDVARKVRKFPRKAASEIRSDLAYIEAVFSE